ncbi:MAG TPA: ferric reductase-like transmembrane domain-containing protein, partial [Gaiellaceae bacterium]|nr:ferric reductase-like transmembrane domain-containing protein [Gaiellaceae bacterium]
MEVRVHLTASPLDWYAARAAGVVAYVLLTSVVALGLTMSSKRTLRAWPRFALEEVHRFGGILVGVFVAIHVVTIAVDAYLRFSIAAIVVPFVTTYRSLWTALGIVAAELLLALAVTNRLRNRRLSYDTWRKLHYANFAVWTAATLHGLAAGTDRGTWWLLALEVAAIVLVAGLTAARFRLPQLQAVSAGVAAGIVALVLATAAFPFHAHPWNARSFHDRLAGTVARDAGPSRELLSVTATGTGDQKLLLRADLLVEPQGLLATSFQIEFLPSGMRCAGSVTHVDALGFEGHCRAGDGTRRVVRAQWE